MEFDPFLVLGVARDSDPADWKRAYRRLAMRWHPDRNTDPLATERFKEINAAYEQLTTADDPEVVDEDYRAEEAPESEPEPSVEKAADIRLNIEVSLEEGAVGCRKAIHYSRGKPCITCDGSGEAGMSRTRFCDDCHGSGRVHDANRTLVRCTACGGRGLFTERICPDCGGSGRDADDVNLEITIPSGMLPGDELRLVGQGEPGDDERQAGDLYLTLIIRSHPLYQLSGRDLQFSMPVSALAMMAGAEIELPSPGGIFGYALEAGVVERRHVCLPGKGYPGRGKHKAGDMLVELVPQFPRKLNAKQRKLLLQANAALLDDATEAMPEIADWRAAYIAN
ncbi:DnaJ domain-containing protein [Dechloromonas sp. XY25]|uniref:DnaJ domain-containing protein n=1 Tax=Dechloromonas hankyongensis TaxID=2908002 RepID=A0ABS9K3S8_9RHOO|nr:DnaJ C-terminal domain-containing protein [Dechloromonas hankyongensis]MCG2577800.1 DnaJ domain-containing protein [Dechloromonas hankyongensis]